MTRTLDATNDLPVCIESEEGASASLHPSHRTGAAAISGNRSGRSTHQYGASSANTETNPGHVTSTGQARCGTQ